VIVALFAFVMLLGFDKLTARNGGTNFFLCFLLGTWDLCPSKRIRVGVSDETFANFIKCFVR
jgi:hypothetical protein